LGRDVGAFGVNIIGLSNKIHQFEYELGDTFFRSFGSDLITQGTFRADVELNKHETFIEATFKIKGTAVLTCDRSLEVFDFPMWTEKKIMFKYGDRNEEISDEIIMINRETTTLEIGQYMYEFVVLAIPIKKLHPKFRAEDLQDDESSEGKIVYSSQKPGDESEEKEIDPRWNILKKLK
jgi:uncharacterized metal-binding protein YceD (DUF177 family)